MAYSNIQEDLFKAIDTIVQARLADLPYDKTIECEVISRNIENPQKYIVEYQNAQFEAYAMSGEYQKEDIVYVTIQQNDFTQPKVIIAKKEVFDVKKIKTLSFLNFLHYKRNYFNYYSETNYQREFTIKTNEIVKEKNITLSNNTSDPSIKFITPKDYIAGYTKMGIRCQIKSSITSDMMSGNYGLHIQLIGYDQTKTAFYIEDTSKPVNSSRIVTLEPRDYWLTMEDMIGVNLYNTYGYVNQEKVFDITNFVIQRIQIFAWQDNNFRTTRNEELKDKPIHIKNIQLFFGYDNLDYDENVLPKIVLYTKDGLLYDKENYHKTLNLRIFQRLKPDSLEFDIIDDYFTKPSIMDEIHFYYATYKKIAKGYLKVSPYEYSTLEHYEIYRYVSGEGDIPEEDPAVNINGQITNNAYKKDSFSIRILPANFDSSYQNAKFVFILQGVSTNANERYISNELLFINRFYIEEADIVNTLRDMQNQLVNLDTIIQNLRAQLNV